MFHFSDDQFKEHSTQDSGAPADRLLRDAKNAATLAHKIRLIDIEGAHRLGWHRSHFNPDQPRVPAGHPDGGQWTSGGEGLERAGSLILSEAAPGGLRVWTQYAEAKNGSEVDNKTAADAADAADAKLIEQTTKTLHNILLQVSNLVIRRPGSSPAAFGTEVHYAFANAVRTLNLPGIGTAGVEQSFDRVGLARYGQDGSIRTDVVLRNHKNEIIAIYDVKTGNAIIRPSRGAELRAMTRAGSNVPVLELHAVRGPAHR